MSPLVPVECRFPRLGDSTLAQSQLIPSAGNLTTAIGLFLLTSGALLVHGYHPFSEDAEIYLPGVEKILHPQLFPVGQEFFASHAHLTLFPNLIAFSLRVTHLPFETGLLLWHLASLLLFLAACWQLTGLLFKSARARWGGVALIAALLTIPVAGTALYILDQYVNPRNLAAFAAVFAVTRVLEKKYLRMLIWLAFAAVVHPLMAAFAFSLCFLLIALELVPPICHPEQSEGSRQLSAPEKLHRFFASLRMTIAGTRGSSLSLLCLLPFGITLAPQASRAYHEAATYHGFHYIQRWAWYEIVGAVAPAALLWWFAVIARKQERHNLAKLCRALVIYNLVYLAAALIVDFPACFEALARLQPLRSLHLLYILMFVAGGGLLAEFVLKNKPWRWLVLFVPLCAGMFAAQRALFPNSAHVELPGVTPRNDWAKAFRWARDNTPEDAAFALDPLSMRLPGEDSIGFRCLAQRSRLADAVKDSGAVSMFPPLADDWWAQMQAQTPWKNFRAEDFARLKQQSGVTWVVVQQPGVAGLDCAYQNSAVRVCRIP